MAGFDLTSASGSESLQLAERGGLGSLKTHRVMEWWPPARRAYGSERVMQY